MLYYYRTHSIYEWKVNDAPQLNSIMSATCNVWLKELDKGREHYKDFNEKNKYTGWRSGLVKTAEIANLKELTFQVTITIFEIYDKDQKNVTNKYIGLGVYQKQTISFLRKELQFEKEKVQKLTIEVDELSEALEPQRKQSMSITSAIYPFPNNYQYGYEDDGVDDEKHCKSPSPSIESKAKNESEDVCNV